MANDFWIFLGLGPVLCIGAGLVQRRRRMRRTAATAAFTRPDGNGVAGTLDLQAAERQLGMILRRMRAYRRAPYNFASSRIRNEAEFDRCLDLATMLGLRIGELSGAVIAAPMERERIRDQILQSLSRTPDSSAALRARADHVGGAAAEAAFASG
jgi:hypothetical protein